MSDRERIALLEAAIAASGLSARRFATEQMLRDERTIRRWLAGDVPIPDVVVARLEALTAGAKKKRR